MSIEINRLEPRKETIEGTINGVMVVRAMRIDEYPMYQEMFAPADSDDDRHQVWIIALPGVVPILGHEIPTMTFSSDKSETRLIVESFANLIAKAQQ